MQSAPLHDQEAQRLQELLRLEILDTQDEPAFDELTELASQICGTSISLISLIDSHRQWFKSRVGLEATQTPRELAFCAHAILQEAIFEVPNALEDARFADNPLVTDDPDIRFYAGMPLVTNSGYPIGTLCVIDKESKKLNDQQKRALEILAKQVMSQLELRFNYKKLQRIDKEREKIFSVIAHDLRSPFTSLLGMAKRLSEKADTLTSDKIQMMAQGVLSSSSQIYQVLDELMQWTQQRMGNKPYNPKLNTLFPLVQESIDILRDSIQIKNIQCENQVDLGAQAWVDGAIFKAIVRNLVANSIKYSPEEGSIVISSSTTPTDLIITVKDQGKGIPLDVIERLFKDVVDSEKDTEGKIGTGLGLSLCAELISTQKGKIWVDQAYNQGACIHFSFPIQR